MSDATPHSSNGMKRLPRTTQATSSIFPYALVAAVLALAWLLTPSLVWSHWAPRVSPWLLLLAAFINACRWAARWRQRRIARIKATSASN